VVRASIAPRFEQNGVRFPSTEQSLFSLTNEQVDKLSAAGRELLRANPDFQGFVAGMAGGRTARR
jgi:hypothetical protein